MVPDYLALQEGTRWLVGSYREDVKPIEEIPQALSRFVNLVAEGAAIGSFTRDYGLLRWGWAHGAYESLSEVNQFYLPLDQFTQSQAELRGFWRQLSCRRRRQGLAQFTEWVTPQLASETHVKSVESPEELWKVAQPKLGMQVTVNDKGALETRLVAGDLWQALCWMLLERLATRTNALRVCQNEKCPNEPYFVATRRGQKYCNAGCSKLVADREYARRKRASLARRKRGK